MRAPARLPSDHAYGPFQTGSLSLFQCGPLPAFLPTGRTGVDQPADGSVSMRAPARLPSDRNLRGAGVLRRRVSMRAPARLPSDPFFNASLLFVLGVSMRAPARLPSDPFFNASLLFVLGVSMRAPARLPSDQASPFSKRRSPGGFNAGPCPPSFRPPSRANNLGRPSGRFQCGPLPAFLPTKQPGHAESLPPHVSMRAPARLPSDDIEDHCACAPEASFNAGPCPPSFRHHWENPVRGPMGPGFNAGPCPPSFRQHTEHVITSELNSFNAGPCPPSFRP